MPEPERWIRDGHAVELIDDGRNVVWLWRCPRRGHTKTCRKRGGCIAAWLGIDVATGVARPGARTVIPAFAAEYGWTGYHWVWRPVEPILPWDARLSPAPIHEEEPMPDEVTGTTSVAEDNRNLQFNPGGDPAREREFLDSQEVKTAEGARASVPQATLPDQGTVNQSIREADVTDTEVEAPGYEAPDAPAGQETGANVNADFEDDKRSETVEGDPGTDATADEEAPAEDEEARTY